REILELRKELRILSDKVDHITGAFSQMSRLMAGQQANMNRDGTGVDGSGAEKKTGAKDDVEKSPAL
ncbi:MAG: hypothetical protein ABII06_20820, partial [Pseudomonadota bacterium]